MDFCERLKNLRKQSGLTQSDFAEKTGVHFQTVSKWERGASIPDISMLGIIATTLGTSLEKLLGEPESEFSVTGNFELSALANAISDYRKHAGLSQAEIAEKLGVTSNAVSKWERGVTTPDFEMLVKIANFFGVPVSHIYYGITKDYTPEKKVFYSKNRRNWLVVSSVCLSVALIVLSLTLFFLPKQKNYKVSVEGETYTVQSGSLFTPPTPEKLGYKFVNWVNEQGEQVDIPCSVESDLTLVAQFLPIEYSVDFWLNGGNFNGGVQTEFTVESGELLLPIPQKENEMFEGWYLSADYSGESVTSITCKAKNETLYAKWQTVVYSVRYELNGGAITVNPQTVTAQEEIVLTAPTKSGYEFLGWYTSQEGGERVEKVGGNKARNLTLYALWQKVDRYYKISYELNGGTLSAENLELIPEGESYKLKTPEKLGYDFICWNDSPEGTGNSYEWITGEKEITLYAIFAPKNYVIRYEYNGVWEIEPNRSFITYGEEVKLNGVILEGYDFVGWYDSETGGNKIEVINENNVNGLSVLYAHYTPKIYEIELNGKSGLFEINGEKVSKYTLKYEYGTVFTLPTCERTSYTFLYWSDENGEIYTEINKTKYYVTALYANFFATNGCEINYITDGGELIGNIPLRFYAGESVQLPTAEKEGYIFLGWNENAEGTGAWYTHTPATDKEVLDIYAIYQDVIVGGDGKYFTYEMSATQVTITDYTGDYGDTINVTIPAYIEGLPVTKLAKGVFGSSEHDLFSLKSITLPKTLRELEEESMRLFSVASPLIIPASVTTIGKNAVFGEFPSIIFEENSELTVLSENAFGGTKIFDVFEVPEGVQEICSYALPYEAFGYILPQSLRKVHSHVFGEQIRTSHIYLTVYLPSGVTEVGENAFCGAKVYTDIEEQTLNTFDQNWCCNFAGVAKEYTLTLMDGNKKISEQQGVAFNLPYLEKQGYNFVGWEREDGTRVCKAFINEQFANVTLYARFSTAGKNDGSSYDNPIIIDLNEGGEFACYTGKPFYTKFIITGPYACNFYITKIFPYVGVYDIQSTLFSMQFDSDGWLITSENHLFGGEETKRWYLDSDYYGYVTYDTFKFIPVTS